MGAEVRSTRVLLVEDEELISELVSDALIEEGFAVYAVATAEEALSHLESGAAIDVLFTDINLPGRLSGTDLAVRARALRPDLPIVYASGRYDASELEPLVPRSVFLAKPYDPADACTLLGRLAPASH
jgi:CheY-like chemotaxis protein